MECVRGMQRATGDALGLELRAWNRSIASAGPDHDSSAGRVLRRQRQVLGHPRQQLVQRSAHRQHCPGRLRLHQRAASGHQAQRIGQGEDAGQRRGDELADAVADHRRRHHAPGSSTVRASAYSIAKVAGCMTAVGSSACGSSPRTDALAQVEAELVAQQLRRTRRTRAESRLALVQAAAHARVLRALPREHEDDFARPRRPAARWTAAASSGVRSCVGRARAHRRRPRRCDARRPCARTASVLGHVGRGCTSRMRLQCVGEPLAPRASAAGVRADSTSSCGPAAGSDWPAAPAPPPAPRARWCRRRRTNSRRRGAACRLRGQSLSASLTTKGDAAKSIAGLALLEVQRWPGCAALRQRQRGLDHAGGAGGDDQVADVALDRADPAEAGVGGAAAEGAGQALDLDRVAQRRGRAVRLDVADAAGIDARDRPAPSRSPPPGRRCSAR